MTDDDPAHEYRSITWTQYYQNTIANLQEALENDISPHLDDGQDALDDLVEDLETLQHTLDTGDPDPDRISDIVGDDTYCPNCGHGPIETNE